MNEDTGHVAKVVKYDFVNDNNGTPFHDKTSTVLDSSRFWITVHHLIPGQQYVFQYLIDDSILIADPYVEQCSVPTYDGQISSSIYPNLIPYPTGRQQVLLELLKQVRPHTIG